MNLVTKTDVNSDPSVQAKIVPMSNELETVETKVLRSSIGPFC